MVTSNGQLAPGWGAIETQLAEVLGEPGRLHSSGPVAGGDINRAYRARFGNRDLFIKVNAADRAVLFEAEEAALLALARPDALRVPEPVCRGQDGDCAWLVMEYLDLRGQGDAPALGRGLAALHRETGPACGWERDNYIGTTLQPNPWTEDWVEFWCMQRLGHQVELAAGRGAGPDLARSWERLAHRVPALFRDRRVSPSLLHGDLWGGNRGYLPDGQPVVFDPASYYGDRETDLAMSELFGGFDAGFHAAYREAFPLEPGYPLRRTLYQLYHVINHFNLFGGAWLAHAARMIESLQAELS